MIGMTTQSCELSRKSPHAGHRTRSILLYGDQMAARNRHLQNLHVMEAPGGRGLPRYRWADPYGKPVYRIGIFAGIHGDEEAGIIAAIQLLQRLAAEPGIGRFHELFVYPICNTWGFDANRREGESGRDMNRLFWQEEREVLLLEQELLAKQFDGIIALHTDDTSEGIYGYVNGSTLTRHLLEPSLQAASEILPRDDRPEIDTHPAERSIITGGYRGILSAPPDQHPKPFEIVFETPHLAPLGLQVEAHLKAIEEILRVFPQISSHGMDI
jgi:murein peptide amidase A